MSIERRGVDRYRIEVTTGRGEGGRYNRIRENFRGTKTEVKRRERELQVQVEQGTAVHAARENVTEYLERWIAHREAIGKLRPKTAKTYRGYVRREIAPRIGELKITAVRPVHLQRVLDEALAGGLSARTVTQIHRILHAALKQALRWQLVTVNPADGVSPPKIEAAKLVTPKPAEVAKLLEQIDPRFRAPLTVAANTGTRRGEVLALKWNVVDLDGDRGRIRIEGTLQRDGDGKLVVLPPKTTRSRRTVPLSASLTAALRAVRTEQLERRMLAGPAWNDGDFVFDRGDGQPIEPDTFSKAFRTASRKAGLHGVRLHDLRHAVATMLVAGGTDVRTVSDLLGHSTVSFTLGTYVHPSEAAAETAIDDLERMLGSEVR